MKEITDMQELLTEIEAYLCFRLMADTPIINEDEIKGIRNSVIHCLKSNGQIVPIING